MPAMPDFSGAGYNPLALRALLRATRDRGERLIAWGVASVKPAASAGEVLRALAPAPLLAASAIGAGGAGARRVVVLSDRRLLLLRPGPLGPSPEGFGLAGQADLGALRVTAEPPAFELLSPGLGRRLRLVVREPDSRDGARLVEALESLAGDAPG